MKKVCMYAVIVALVFINSFGFNKSFIVKKGRAFTDNIVNDISSSDLNLTSSNEKPKIGDTIELSLDFSNPEPGKTYEYKFVIHYIDAKNRYSDVYGILYDKADDGSNLEWSENTVRSYTVENDGRINIYAYVREKGTTVKGTPSNTISINIKEAIANLNYEIVKGENNKKEKDINNLEIGDKVVFTASASGGYEEPDAYKYKFFLAYVNPDTGKLGYSSLQNFSTSQSYTYTVTSYGHWGVKIRAYMPNSMVNIDTDSVSSYYIGLTAPELSNDEILTEVEKSHQKLVDMWAEKLSVKDNVNKEKIVNDYIDRNNFKTLGKLYKSGQDIKSSVTNERVNLTCVSLFHILDYGDMYTLESLEALKYWGVNCIRIPAYMETWTSSPEDDVTAVELGLDTSMPEYFEKMDSIIEMASELGLYSMVDFHCMKSNGDIYRNFKTPIELDGKTYNSWADFAKEFFTHFTEKYGSTGQIIWEITGEPFTTTDEHLITFSKEIIDIIKTKDSNPIIMIGANVEWYGGVDELYQHMLEEYETDTINSVFISLHYYYSINYYYEKNSADIVGKSSSKIQDSFLNLIERYYNSGVPMVVTEWANFNRNKGGGTDDQEKVDLETGKVMKFFYDKGILNSLFMLCHSAQYPHSIWNPSYYILTNSNLLKYGAMSEEYLSDDAKKVLENSFYNNLIINSETYKYSVVDDFIDLVDPNTSVTDYIDKLGINSWYTYKMDISEDTLVPTRSKIKIFKDSKQVLELTNIVRGDVSCDGRIKSQDYIIVKNHIMGKNVITDSVLEKAADANLDNDISSKDYIRIKKIVMGLN